MRRRAKRISPKHRSQVAAAAEEAVEALVVLEAADGTEAVTVGLQRHPRIALLDVNLPRLGGIEVALILRELLPGVRLALHTRDPAAHSSSAHEFCLPLFDEPASERTLRWLETRRGVALRGRDRLLCPGRSRWSARSAAMG